MKEKPIIFCTDMVMAILADRKTMTRRIIKPDIVSRFVIGKDGRLLGSYTEEDPEAYPTVDDCQYHVDGVLWVRETFGNYSYDEPESNATYYMYRADYPDGAKGYWYEPENINFCDFPRWRPSIHMPRDAARIILKVTNVRAERLQDITEEDARREGCIDYHDKIGDGKFNDVLEFDLTARDAFSELWNNLNEKRGYGWDSNPWVWVIEFERVNK